MIGRIVSAVTYRDHILIFTEYGRIIKMVSVDDYTERFNFQHIGHVPLDVLTRTEE